MILHLAILLTFQLIGEGLSRVFLPTLPGPVIGLVLALLAFVAAPRLAETIRPTATGILANLSLLFVPAGVGVVSHWRLLASDGPALVIALVGSTVLALLVGAFVFLGVARLLGQGPER
ncbi:CidA/LrgA family protein [Rhodobacterales bacterium HKCCE2091]|nr:CidA/LrgA family protein [Rhodobacterales bacterium HKCCE2091]